ncbi:TPR repeat-containing thioredoxin TDX-like [Salvia splendens]|uniref:TPR repeat-containing thioredoxin TDX-like n=1 Tax=Salvia splendens TaxID=180675 RepID=UPI001C26D054|nr:TPR repeat-containing thioredoxin TDX-like [Salvia splendens]
MEAERIQELKGLVDFCKLNPHVLHTPTLAFFKNFLQSFGARFPAIGGSSNDGDDHEDKKPFASRKRDAPMEDTLNKDIVESDAELDKSDIVEPGNDPPRKLGCVEVTEDDQEADQLSKAKALEALAEGEVILIHSGSDLDEKLDAASKASRLSVLYFTATWCGPCLYVGPVFTSLAAKYPKVVFLKVDIDKARQVAFEWDISSIPTFFFIRNGEEVDQLVTVDKNALEQKIAQHA